MSSRGADKRTPLERACAILGIPIEAAQINSHAECAALIRRMEARLIERHNDITTDQLRELVDLMRQTVWLAEQLLAPPRGSA